MDFPHLLKQALAINQLPQLSEPSGGRLLQYPHCSFTKAPAPTALDRNPPKRKLCFASW